MPPPLPQHTRDNIIRLHAEGLTRNAIARSAGVSAASVTKVCAAAGLTFDRSQTHNATKARQVDLAVERTRLAEKMIGRAHKALDSLDSPYLVYSFGGKDNTYAEHSLPSAPLDAQQRAMTLGAIAFDKVTRVLDQADDSQVQQVRAFLLDLGGEVKAALEEEGADAVEAASEEPRGE